MSSSPTPPPGPIVVTGANGQLGRTLLARLAMSGHSSVRALVRSERARDTVCALGLAPAPQIRVVDYTSPREMGAAIAGATAVIHLVGIIKEWPGARYVEAHEQTCHALAVAASRSGVERIVYLSILGSTPDSENDCLSSKGRAETLLLDGRVATTVIRVPMVLGGNDPASASLRRSAQASKLRLIAGGRTLQQPIDARDVIRAILAACTAAPGRDLALDAGGPECLSHRNLVLRAARLWQNEPRIASIPIGPTRFAVGILDRVLRNPPITRAMFEILQHDDRVDPDILCRSLDLELIPLDQTLSDHVGPASVEMAAHHNRDRATEPGSDARDHQGDQNAQ
ncbi:MAG: NAD(P)H-binding protein [bacterium]|nr:NAD(P)H-binding protein [bacterium]